MSNIIEIDMPVTDEFIGDILVCAFDGSYGSSWSWAKSGSSVWPLLKDGQWSEIHIRFDVEDVSSLTLRNLYRKEISEKMYVTVNQETVTVGIARILADKEYSSKFHDRLRDAVAQNDAGEIDANDADCIIQEGLFGKQIYG